MDSTLSRRDQGLIRGGAKIFALRRSVLSSRRTRLPPIGASLPRLGAATPRASPQFTSELAIERQHYGLVGKATPLLVRGPLLLEKLAAFLILIPPSARRCRQDPEAARADGVGRADPRRAAPHPIVIREAHRLAGDV